MTNPENKPLVGYQELDQGWQVPAPEEQTAGDVSAVPFDFRHSNRLPNSQLALIRALHESYVRILTSSLSLYLQSYVSGSIVNIEQSSYGDFSDRLESPTCIIFMSMHPYEGYGTMEVNHSLLAPVLDKALGGNDKIHTELDREITEIEKGMLEGFFQIISHDLTQAWKTVAPISFAFHTVETDPHLSKRIARTEAIVVIGIELRLGEKVGVANLVIPSITLKRLRHNLDPDATTRRSGSSATEAAIKQKLSDGLKVDVACGLVGSSIRLRDLLSLKPGDLIDLGVACDHRGTVLVNGAAKFNGEVVTDGSKQSIVLDSIELPD
jgi:flagellar motor switch protein FliM